MLVNNQKGPNLQSGAFLVVSEYASQLREQRPPLCREVGQVRENLRLTKFGRVPSAVISDIPEDPAQICLLSTRA